jgi:thiamine biosynthesis protein ThiC
MFMINMPLDFKVGETRDCKINREPKRITWRNQHTLVIEPDDARQIFHTEVDGDMRCFMCGDAGAKRARLDRELGGVIVSQED